MLPRLPGRILALLVVALFAGCAQEAPAEALTCDIDLVSHLDDSRAMDHLRVLSADLGSRVASSPEERVAAKYLAEEFVRYGYIVEVQDFPRPQIVAHLEAIEPSGIAVRAASGRLRGVSAEEYPLLTPDGGITGRVVDCGAGECPPEAAGAIALITAGEGAEAEGLIAGAARAGATAAILHGPDWRRFVVSVSEAAIPFVSVNSEAAEVLRASGAAELNLQVNRYETSQNVIATRGLEGGEPDAPVVVFSAHYDAVEKSPGANDNGSGTVGLLELARVLAEIPVGVELRFAAVGAEEGGLVGSRYYVSQLSEAERERIVANLNMDMIGTAGEAQTQLFVNTLDGDNRVARSARAAREALGLPEAMLRAPYQRGASDHVAFHDAGIPAANFIWREPESASLEPWYHQPHDAIENVSPERLRTALSVVLTASLPMVCEVPAREGAN
jgi:aminopeptidase YwaD